MNQPLQHYQENCIEQIVLNAYEESHVHLAFGLGKFRMMGELLHNYYKDGLRFVVMENHDRVQQFVADYLQGSLRSLVFSSSFDTVENPTSDHEALEFVSTGDGVIVVSYNSLQWLVQTVGNVRDVSCLLFDEPCGFNDVVDQWIGNNSDVLRRRVLFTSVPYEEPLLASEETNVASSSGELRIHFGLYDSTDSSLCLKVKSLLSSSIATGITHRQIICEAYDHSKFVEFCEDFILTLVPSGATFKVERVDASTSVVDHRLFLNNLNSTPKGNLRIITQGESVPEENRLVAFIHAEVMTPKMHTIVVHESATGNMQWCMSYENSAPFANLSNKNRLLPLSV